MPTSEDGAQHNWLQLRLDGDVEGGVDARALANLLTDVVAAARFIADERLGVGPRRGPMNTVERGLASFRVTSVSPGSVVIQLAAPRTATERQLAFASQDLGPDTIADSLVSELNDISQGTAHSEGGYERRRMVERIVRSAGQIGRVAEVTRFNSAVADAEPRVVLLQLDAPVQQPVAPELTIRQTVLYGHVYMADVEMGRQRLRIKLPDDSDQTMAIDDNVVDHAAEALGQLAEVHVSEATVDGRVMERVVGHIRLLEASERGVDLPPKSIQQLAQEQGLAMRPTPNYVELLSELWPTESDAEAFREYLRTSRATAG